MNKNKKNSPLLPFFVIPFAAVVLMLDTNAAPAIIVALLFLAVPALLIYIVVKVLKKAKGSEVHTHDRIDHRSDLTIDARTGKAMPTSKAAHVHSPQEHWKQQLDGLLANGTIDKAEYKTLLNRKFN